MAELLGRKPLFPGKDYMHQLHLIIEILGTPSHEDTEYIASEKVPGSTHTDCSHCSLIPLPALPALTWMHVSCIMYHVS
jgi:hypothetical protein